MRLAERHLWLILVVLLVVAGGVLGATVLGPWVHERTMAEIAELRAAGVLPTPEE